MSKKRRLSVYLFVLVLVLSCSFNNINAQECEDCSTLKLDSSQRAEFEKQAKEKVSTLSKYIKRIGNRSNDDQIRDMAINSAVKLFSSEDNVVEVSNVKSDKPPRRHPIRNYLMRLKMLPYDQVKITWYDINIATELTKRPDGRYEGVVSIWQRFTGENNNEMGNYTDVTKKNIQVILDKKRVYRGDDVEERWSLLLGDIKVRQTKAR